MADVKKLIDFAREGDKRIIQESPQKDLEVREPSFAAFAEWQAAASNAGQPGEKPMAGYWSAVNACVRSPGGGKAFLTEDDFTEGKARLQLAIGSAANSYLIEYITEGNEKKAT